MPPTPDKRRRPIPRKLGRNIKRLRLAAGLSQAQLGNLAGYTRQGIYYIEQGEANASAQGRMTLAAALGVTVADLLK